MTKKRFVGIALSSILWMSGAFGQSLAQLDSDAALANAQSMEVDEAGARAEFRSLDEDVQSLKKEVLDLNRDLFLLEEELLFPANSQVAFFAFRREQRSQQAVRS